MRDRSTNPALTRRFVLSVAAALGFACVAGRAQAADRWLVMAEGGLSEVHGDDRSAGGALRVSRDLGSSPIRLQLGLAAAAYGALDLGLEWRLSPQARVSPFLGVGGGLMAEEDYEEGTFVRATAGLEARLAPKAVLRLSLQAGTHGGQAGPHLATVGIGVRF